ncbi:CAP-Gly domain protein [Mesorhizobium sp.]|uniref:CAP-Gly domain protein n=1 Tax=Mesorhizobium sp. TaxID=1871066 RepID=UPI000FE83AD9|nr:CAP-Gly domain protein [Mesorhizobium sp.]RWO20634.1 MAG: CAP-Gly domain protein [Mesorhizobium sp.]
MTNNDDFDPARKFHVGQDVVCVKADYDPAQRTTITPELAAGQIYKIRWLGIYSHYLDGEYLGIRVEGIDRGTCKFWGDVDQPFRASRFRPVVPDKLASLKNIVADPDGYKPEAPEGPVRSPDDGSQRVKEREKEEV